MSKKICSKPPLWVSQNFLTQKKVIRRILSIARLENCSHIVEIGPGKGHITRELLTFNAHVTAIELDHNLYLNLNKRYGNFPNLTLIKKDFLLWNLPAKGDYTVFSNIPFSLTTKIVEKILYSRNSPLDSWLIMEKGAAKRFLGLPRESLHSLMLKPVYESCICYYFCKTDFHPVPTVDIVLLHFHRKERPDLTLKELQKYRTFIQTFMKKGPMSLFTKKQYHKSLGRAGLIHSTTPGEISYIQWLCLFRCYMLYQ